MAKRAMERKLYSVYTQFVGQAIAANPKLAASRTNSLRYNAACCAVLASSGQGRDIASQNKTSPIQLRQKAYQWLREELDLHREMLASTQETNEAVERSRPQAECCLGPGATLPKQRQANSGSIGCILVGLTVRSRGVSKSSLNSIWASSRACSV